MTDTTKLNILIVDDEDIVHVTLSTLLKHLNHHVESAFDGTTALQKIKTNSFDLVLLDIRMPDIDGFEVLENIQDLMPPLRVIVITGHGDPTMSDKAKALGAYHFFIKPISLMDLQEMITKVTEEKTGAS